MNETEPFGLNEIINGKADSIMGFRLSVLYLFIFSEKNMKNMSLLIMLLL